MVTFLRVLASGPAAELQVVFLSPGFKVISLLLTFLLTEPLVTSQPLSYFLIEPPVNFQPVVHADCAPGGDLLASVLLVVQSAPVS